MVQKNMQITIRKKNDSKEFDDDCVEDPVECINILEHLRLEAENFLYDKPVTFQRVITVIRKK
jgi:hypothetical protein